MTRSRRGSYRLPTCMEINLPKRRLSQNRLLAEGVGGGGKEEGGGNLEKQNVVHVAIRKLFKITISAYFNADEGRLIRVSKSGSRSAKGFGTLKICMEALYNENIEVRNISQLTAQLHAILRPRCHTSSRTKMLGLLI